MFLCGILQNDQTSADEFVFLWRDRHCNDHRAVWVFCNINIREALDTISFWCYRYRVIIHIC